MTVSGLDLENLCFSHGQWYAAACSYVGKPRSIFVVEKYIRYIVHHLVFNWVKIIIIYDTLRINVK